MANVDGDWDIVMRTPMGDQQAVLTVRSDGDSFSGSMSSPLGSMEIPSGKVEGDTLRWKMEVKAPFPMKLDCDATVTGDSIAGGVKAGIFGISPLSGTRKS
jgi:hypothetical protein